MTKFDNVIVGIQARTNSSRLPAKVLLPVGGIPLSVLAAKRVMGNPLFDVCVLTSNEESDDLLARTLDAYSIPYFRGDLNNVLKRYVDAFSAYSDDTILVRLTADNVFPDAKFLEEVVMHFVQANLDYVTTNGEGSILPYGMSVEVTRMSHIRNAYRSTNSEHDLEHVTPYIRHKFGTKIFQRHCLKQDLSRIRCTIDNLDDFLTINRLFNDIDNPISISCWELVARLQAKYKENQASKLVLGTVQLGLDYGIGNIVGLPSDKQAHNILSKAVESGVEYIDTARAYGNSESVIGRWLSRGWKDKVKVITKLDPLLELSDNSSAVQIKTCVEHSILKSCYSLGLQQLDVVMLHRAHHLQANNGQVFLELNRLKEQGKIKELGVSVQNPEELLSAIDNPLISFIQMPFNILDHRWQACVERIKKVKKTRKLYIHARSVYLQGLLLTQDYSLWRKANVGKEQAESIIHLLSLLKEKLECDSLADLCLKYVASQDWVDALVLGCETEEQLLSNVSMISKTPDALYDLSYIENPIFSDLSEKTLNPSKWQ